jgi:hypothetical protein
MRPLSFRCCVTDADPLNFMDAFLLEIEGSRFTQGLALVELIDGDKGQKTAKGLGDRSPIRASSYY